MKRSDKQVQGTNDSSILSKHSMVNLGYFDDPFVKEMVYKSVRRAPLINKGYYIRMKAVEFALTTFLKRFSNTRKHIVSLGAGFDTSYFRLKSQGHLQDVLFVEIDFLDVAFNKARIILDREPLSAVLKTGNNDELTVQENNYVIMDCPDYKLLGVSLAQLDTLEACLRSVGLDENTPTLFLSECVMSYISEKRTSSLISFLSQSYSNSTFVLYEQMQPHDGFGKLMMNHFRKTGAPLLSLDKFPTKAAQRNRFLKAGWAEVEVLDMNEFYLGILSAEERRRVEELEVFDEYEEFHLKCEHYFLLIAQTNDSVSPMRYLPSVQDSETPPQQLQGRTVKSSSDAAGWRVHAHACLPCRDAAGRRWMCRVGGYGQNPIRGKGYSRLTSISLVAETGGEVVHVLPENDELLDGGIFRSCCVVEEGYFLLFGGRISPLCPSSNLVELRVWQEEGEWRTSCRRREDEEGERPGPRWRHATTSLQHEEKRMMLICGGRDKSGKILDDAYLYDVDNKVWERCDPMPFGGRCSFRLTSISNSCCLLSCGLDSEKIPTSSLFLFSLPERCWRPVLLSDPLAPRFNHSAHVIRSDDSGTLITLLGGVGGSSNGSRALMGLLLLLLQPHSATASVTAEYHVDLSHMEEPCMLFDHDSVFTEEGQLLLVCGGGGNCFSFGTHLNERLIGIDVNSALNSN